MKYRNGFVSNSSSASFILLFPSYRYIELKNIEKYFGGFSNEMSKEANEIFAFELWKSQYFDSENCKRTFESVSEKYFYYFCTAPLDYIKEKCLNYRDGIDHQYPNSACITCKYCAFEELIDRDDDYYKVLDVLYSDEDIKWLKRNKNKKIIYLEVDDNNPPCSVPFSIAGEITSNANLIFKNPKNVKCLGGK